MGEFRVVYEAKAIDLIGENTITTVAVKTVSENVDLYHTLALIIELKTMIKLGNHLNIVKLLGTCTGCINSSNAIFVNVDKSYKTIDLYKQFFFLGLMVIEEYCHFGNVHQYLRKHRDNFSAQSKKDDCKMFMFETLSK